MSRRRRPLEELRFDAEPVLRLAGDRDSQRAARLGVDRRSVVRYRADGRLSAATADRLAMAAGYHPCEVWGDEWRLAADESAAS